MVEVKRGVVEEGGVGVKMVEVEEIEVVGEGGTLLRLLERGRHFP